MKKVLSISLALIILMSNVGLTFATHFCGGEAVKSEMMIGHNYLDCGMADMDMTKPNTGNDEDSFSSTDCCKNQYQTFEVKEDYQNNNFHQSLQISFVVAFFHTFQNPIIPVEFENREYKYYLPPLLQQDIPVLNQVFTI